MCFKLVSISRRLSHCRQTDVSRILPHLVRNLRRVDTAITHPLGLVLRCQEVIRLMRQARAEPMKPDLTASFAQDGLIVIQYLADAQSRDKTLNM